MKKYAVIIERASDGSYGAYVPDLPVCAATAYTRREVLKRIREGINLHIEELKKNGAPVPKPITTTSEVQINIRSSPEVRRAG